MFIVSLFFLALLWMPNSLFSAQSRRLCMFFDYQNAEKISQYKHEDKDSIAARFAINLVQQASSCIIHKSVFLNFLNRKKAFLVDIPVIEKQVQALEEEIGTVDTWIKGTGAWSFKNSSSKYTEFKVGKYTSPSGLYDGKSIYQLVQDYLTSLTKEKSKLNAKIELKKKAGQWYKTAKLDPATWNIYHIPKTPLFAVMLKTDPLTDKIQYQINTDDAKTEKLITIPIFKQDQWEECKDSGNISTLDEEKESIKKIINFIDTRLNTSKAFSVNDIKAIFKTEKDFSENKDIKAMIEEFKDAGKNILEKETDQGTNVAKRFLRSWNIFIAGHGNVDYAIAGVPAKDFTDILIFLNNLNTNFVIIDTCSSGGKNTNYFKFKEQTPLNLSYCLAIAGIGDAPTIMTKGMAGEKIEVGTDSDIKKFFEALEEKSPTTTELKEDAKNRKNKKIPTPAYTHKNIWLKKVLSYLTLAEDWFYTDNGINSIPQVWLPGTGWFNPITIDPSIKTIHEVTLQKHKALGKAIVINDALALLIEPAMIDVDLTISPKQVEDKEIPDNVRKKLYRFPVMLDYLDKCEIKIKYGENSIEEPTTKSLIAPKEKFYEFYPIFIPTNKQSDFYFFKKVIVDSKEKSTDKSKLKKHSGILHFMRDSLLKTEGRETKKFFFIKELTGYNDLSIILNAKGYDVTSYSITKKWPKSPECLSTLEPLFNQTITLHNCFIAAWEEKEKKNVDIQFTIIPSDGKKSHWHYSGRGIVHESEEIVCDDVWNFSKLDEKEYMEKILEVCSDENAKELTKEERMKHYIEKKLLEKGIAKNHTTLYDQLYAEYTTFCIDEKKYQFTKYFSELTPSDIPQQITLNKQKMSSLFTQLKASIDKKITEDKNFDEKLNDDYIKNTLNIKPNIIITNVHDQYKKFCNETSYKFNYTWPWDASLMKDNKAVTLDGNQHFKPLFEKLKELNKNKSSQNYKEVKYLYFLKKEEELSKDIKRFLAQKHTSPNYNIGPLYEAFKEFIEKDDKYNFPEKIILQPSTEKITLETFEIKELFEELKQATPEQLESSIDKGYKKLTEKIESFLNGTLFHKEIKEKSLKEIILEKPTQILLKSIQNLHSNLIELKKNVQALSVSLKQVHLKLETLKSSLKILSQKIKT